MGSGRCGSLDHSEKTRKIDEETGNNTWGGEKEGEHKKNRTLGWRGEDEGVRKTSNNQKNV